MPIDLNRARIDHGRFLAATFIVKINFDFGFPGPSHLP
jgi:hypothetical protein